MSAILTTVFSLLSDLPGMLGDYFKRKQELEKIKLDTQLQIEHEKQKLAGELAKADYQRAIEGLKSTGQWFKYCVFWMFASPFISCLIGYPEYAERVFQNLEILPADYKMIFFGMIGIIWGIPVPGSIMGNVWEGIKNAMEKRREYKLAKIDRKAYYETIRKFNNNSPIPQKFVDQQEAVFNELEKTTNG